MLNFDKILKVCTEISIVLGVVTTVVTLVTGVITYMTERDDRKHNFHATAWSLVAQNATSKGNAGLRWALELLIADSVDMRSLHLIGVDLARTNLKTAKLSYSIIEWSNLYDVDFANADLSFANFWCSTLADSDLTHANLHGAVLAGANVSRADFRNNPTFTKEQLSRTCVSFDENQSSPLPKADFEIRNDMFLTCSPAVNGVRQCLEPR